MPETQKPGDDIVSTTPGRRRRGKNVDRRRGQTGQVFQKGWCRGKKWDPEASTYVRYLVDVPGLEERKLKCVTLGTFRTLTLAEQAAREYMQANGVNDRQAQEQSIISLTFRHRAGSIEAVKNRSACSRRACCTGNLRLLEGSNRHMAESTSR